MARKKRKSTKSRAVPSFFARVVKPFLILCGIALFLAWLGAWFFLSGSYDKTRDYLYQQYLEKTASTGLVLQSITVEGVENADRAAVDALINAAPGDPLMAINPKGIKEQLEKISWVKTAIVQRRFPDTLRVKIIERVPVAIYVQPDGGEVLIDREGVILTDERIMQYGARMALYGDGAGEVLDGLLSALENAEAVNERMVKAEWAGARRWNIGLRSGVIVKLPEENMPDALARLEKAQAGEKLLDRKIKVIDARTDGRLILETERGQAEDLIQFAE